EKGQLSKLQILGPYGETISFQPCTDETSGAAKDADGYYLLDGGWLCKKGDAGYYLYNPYAFCKLDGENLPSDPKPGYLENRIPSGTLKRKWAFIEYEREKQYAWDLAKQAIDSAQMSFKGAGLGTGSGASGSGSSGGATEDGSSTPEDESASGTTGTEAEEKYTVQLPSEFWRMSNCKNCKNLCWAKLGAIDLPGSKNEGDENYICNHKDLLPSGYLCKGEDPECVITMSLLSSAGAVKVQCPCTR
ncbi:MAG: hypothetical protein JW727_03970, partial [Candidatus Aenigmarchaeota archaeon]|nr:hypothetical protein [Candidatus Aenigmarchaeota archaeon]